MLSRGPEALRHVVAEAYALSFPAGAAALWRLPEMRSHIWWMEENGSGSRQLVAKGPSFQPMAIPSSSWGRLSIVGIEPTPAAAALVLGVEASSLVGRTIPLVELWGEAAKELERSAMNALSWPERLRLLFDALEARKPRLPAPASLVTSAAAEIAQSRGAARMDGIAALLGISPRHLHRLFSVYVGCSPKKAARLARLEHLLERLMLAGEEIDWARSAAELDYSDQSHLIADFRALMGMTPERFATACRSERLRVEFGWLLSLGYGSWRSRLTLFDAGAPAE